MGSVAHAVHTAGSNDASEDGDDQEQVAIGVRYHFRMANGEPLPRNSNLRLCTVQSLASGRAKAKLLGRSLCTVMHALLLTCQTTDKRQLTSGPWKHIHKVREREVVNGLTGTQHSRRRRGLFLLLRSGAALAALQTARQLGIPAISLPASAVACAAFFAPLQV